jgi:YVTN family beta-propeller protein
MRRPRIERRLEGRLRPGLRASVVAVVLLGVCASGAWAAGPTAYVVNSGSGTVTPINVATNNSPKTATISGPANVRRIVGPIKENAVARLDTCNV